MGFEAWLGGSCPRVPGSRIWIAPGQGPRTILRENPPFLMVSFPGGMVDLGVVGRFRFCSKSTEEHMFVSQRSVDNSAGHP